MTYAVRKIDLTFQLGTGNFGGSGSNKLTISGLRCFVQIEQANISTPGQCFIRVYGLTLDQINQLTNAGLVFQTRKNFVAVQAGDDQSGMTTIYNGTIYDAYPDFSEMPNTAFVIVANPAAVIQMQPTPPVSFKGSVDVATALGQILKPTGLTLENNGVSVTLSNPYFPGTAWQQIQSICVAANIFAYHDPVRNVLAIWPKGGSRSTPQMPVISPETGMIGYPEFRQNRIRVRALFDPTIKGVGTLIQVKSQLSAAAGTWVVDQISYNLAAQAPGGPWEMAILAHPQTMPGASPS